MDEQWTDADSEAMLRASLMQQLEETRAEVERLRDELAAARQILAVTARERDALAAGAQPEVTRWSTNYVQAALDAVAVDMAHQDPVLLRLYALLALTKGTGTTLRDVHDAWSLWRLATRPDHPSIVPFDQLTREVQELDRPYMEAIHRAARALAAMQPEVTR